MEHRYRQLMRRVRLYLLTEVRKKSWASKFLSARVFDSVYWSWDRQSVATGAAWGAAAAIAPLPMQSLWGVFACLWRKGNIPVAILMAWLSPPGFTFFAIPAQWWLGWFLFSILGFPTSGANWEMLKAGSAVVLDAVWRIEHRHGKPGIRSGLDGFQRCSGQPVLRAGAVGMEDGPVPAQQKKERQVVIAKLPSV